jgi:hypothetical protein
MSTPRDTSHTVSTLSSSWVVALGVAQKDPSAFIGSDGFPNLGSVAKDELEA